MAIYNLTIETEGEETIIFNDDTNENGETIDSVHFKMNTLNDDTLNRSSAVRCEMLIKGKINIANRKETLKLAKWAMTRSGENKLYREVKVEVFTDSGREQLLREYKVDQMFCIDYDEEFKDNTENKETGEFTLYIAQREGKHTTDIFCE